MNSKSHSPTVCIKKKQPAESKTSEEKTETKDSEAEEKAETKSWEKMESESTERRVSRYTFVFFNSPAAAFSYPIAYE